MQYLIYCIYNLFSLALTLWVLLFTNTYINELLIPALLRKSFGSELLVRFLLANFEAGILTSLVYLLNKRYAERYIHSRKTSNLAGWTTVAVTMVIVVLTSYFLYEIYERERQ